MATDSRSRGPGRHPRQDEGQEAEARSATPWWMWIAVAAIVVFCLFPFYWLVNLSLKTGADLGESSLFPPNPTLDNYESIFQNDDFIRALLNSAIISLVDDGARARRRLVLRLRARAPALQGQVRDPRAGAVDHDVPGDRDRRAAVPPVVGHRHLQHADRPDHPEPHVRAAAGHLHPGLLLQGDPEGPRGGGARRRRDPLHGVPEGRGAARGAGARHGGDPDVHRDVERVPAGDHADVVPGRDGRCRRRSRSSPAPRSSRSPTGRSRPRR